MNKGQTFFPNIGYFTIRILLSYDSEKEKSLDCSDPVKAQSSLL
jgi:hypothetical protein